MAAEPPLHRSIQPSCTTACRVLYYFRPYVKPQNSGVKARPISIWPKTRLTGSVWHQTTAAIWCRCDPDSLYYLLFSVVGRVWDVAEPLTAIVLISLSDSGGLNNASTSGEYSSSWLVKASAVCRSRRHSRADMTTLTVRCFKQKYCITSPCRNIKGSSAWIADRSQKSSYTVVWTRSSAGLRQSGHHLPRCSSTSSDNHCTKGTA